MSQKLTLEDARQSLTAHVAAKGEELREKYGPAIGWSELSRILADRDIVRYPCELVFDAAALEVGECAHPVPKGPLPEDGFIMQVHPFFSVMPAQVPHLVLYQLVLVNYGEFASADDAEVFGAAALGLSRDQYYNTLCELADLISEDAAMEPPPAGPAARHGSCQAGSCGCQG
ncbi:MAG TPA: hypothetical protein VFB27_01155 [Opitutaceae bacterium]|nr:hypothetical protein [Opitutaceae bacterium]